MWDSSAQDTSWLQKTRQRRSSRGRVAHRGEPEGAPAEPRGSRRDPLSVPALAAAPAGAFEAGIRSGFNLDKETGPRSLMRKLATLVPPPRRNLVRYHGLFAPHSALRAKVVVGSSACARDCSPDGPAPQPEPAAPAACAGSTEPRPPATTPPARARSRVPWVELLSRVFKLDVLKCENCGGRMTVLAFLTERTVVKKILDPGTPWPTA
jgi:hypothetical protein